MDKQNLRKIYSRNQIIAATFFGGAFVAIYLIAQNFITFRNKVAAKKTIIIGLVGSLIIPVVIFLIPDKLVNSIPSALFSFIPVFISYSIVSNYQSKNIEEYLKNGYLQASSLGVFGKTLISFLINVIIIIIIIVIGTQNFNTIDNEYLTKYCNSIYKESAILINQKYVTEDSICFIFRRIENKGSSPNQIYDVLNLKHDYLAKIRSSRNSLVPFTDNSLRYDLVSYILDNQTTSLSSLQIKEILQLEEDYLKLTY